MKFLVAAAHLKACDDAVDESLRARTIGTNADRHRFADDVGRLNLFVGRRKQIDLVAEQVRNGFHAGEMFRQKDIVPQRADEPQKPEILEK